MLDLLVSYLKNVIARDYCLHSVFVMLLIVYDEHVFVMLLIVYDEHVRRGKGGGGNTREMDFESFLDFVLALENKDTPEGLAYLFRCLDLSGRGFLITPDIHSLFR